MPFINFNKSIICESVWHPLNTSSLKYSPAVCAITAIYNIKKRSQMR